MIFLTDDQVERRKQAEDIRVYHEMDEGLEIKINE